MVEVYDNIITKDNVKDWIKLLIAFNEGREVQCQEDTRTWYSRETIIPMSKVYYRIKPEEKYVPFTFDDNLIGKTIISKYKERLLISLQNEDGISSIDNFIDYDSLLKNYTFIDGTPCGNYSEQ